MGTAHPHQIQSAVTYTIIYVHEKRKSRYSLGYIACISSPNMVISGYKMKLLAHHIYMQFCVFPWLPDKLTLNRVRLCSQHRETFVQKKKVVQFQRFFTWTWNQVSKWRSFIICVSWIQVRLHQLDVVLPPYTASCCLGLQQTVR